MTQKTFCGVQSVGRAWMSYADSKGQWWEFHFHLNRSIYAALTRWYLCPPLKEVRRLKQSAQRSWGTVRWVGNKEDLVLVLLRAGFCWPDKAGNTQGQHLNAEIWQKRPVSTKQDHLRLGLERAQPWVLHDGQCSFYSDIFNYTQSLLKYSWRE